MMVPNPVKDSLHDFAVLLGGYAAALLSSTMNQEMTEEAVRYWEQDRRLRAMVQKLWDEGNAWGYERAKAEGRERSEARGQDLTALAIKFENLGNEANAAWVNSGDAELEVIANVYYKCARSIRRVL